MKFKLIKEVEGEVNCYGQMCKTGGTIELDGHLAEKAKANPDFVIPRQKNGKQSRNTTTSG